MAQRKYIVRDGFVVRLTFKRPDGQSYDRDYQGGEEVALDDDAAAQHAHKLEYASQKDRDAALAAEKEARIAQAATGSPAELVQQLIAALGAAVAAGQAAQAAQA